MTPLKRFLLIMALTLMWSPSFLFIKLALTSLPPFTIVFFRVFLSALVVMGILKFRREKFPQDRLFWFHAAMMALFSSVLPFVLFCYAEQTIESALAAILNGCSPIFTALIAQFYLPSDKLNAQKAVGVGLGVGGLLLLFAPNILNGFQGTFAGTLAGAAAALCYAISHIYGKKHFLGLRPFVAPASQLLVSSFLLLPLCLTFDKPWTLPMPTVTAIMGLLGLVAFGTVTAFILYYKLLEHCGPTSLSMVACFFPIIGMGLGFLFLGESFSSQALVAALMIFSGMLFVNELFPFKSIRKDVLDEFT